MSNHTCAAIIAILMACAACSSSGNASASPSPTDRTLTKQPTAAARDWTCAAYCITQYHCVSNGDSTWNATVLTSRGDSAATAFKQLADQCTTPVDRLVTHFDCTGGKAESIGATVASSCGAT
jgi:hypothetical protein